MARSLTKTSQSRSLVRHRLVLVLGALASLGLLTILTRRKATPPSTSSANSSSQSSSSISSSVWHDHDTIGRLTKRAYHTIVPTFVSHLSQFNAPKPFNQVYIVSGWIDTRPLIVGKSPELVLIATAPSKGFFDRETNQFPENPLSCFVSIRRFATGETTNFVRRSILQPQDAPDGHVSRSH